jgi:hypothetical protein
VAGVVRGREEAQFGDLGRPSAGRCAAGSLRRTAVGRPACGRAHPRVALGAFEYSVQLSSNTSWASEPDDLLARRDL